MPRSRFFVTSENIQRGTARLTPDQAHHMRDVLRVRAGDAVEIFDGRGQGYSGIVEILEREVFITSLEQLVPEGESPLDLALALALTKADRFEWTLQKATELGVSEIVPVSTRNCSVRLSENRIRGRMERWEKIVREASKQCRRLSVPTIDVPIRFEELLDASIFQDATRLLFYEKSSNRWEWKSLPSSRLLVCIGPEGGWDAQEVEAAAAGGYQVFNLGPRVLRAETAAVVAVAILQHRFGDLGPHK